MTLYIEFTEECEVCHATFDEDYILSSLWHRAVPEFDDEKYTQNEHDTIVTMMESIFVCDKCLKIFLTDKINKKNGWPNKEVNGTERYQRI